MGQVIFIVSIIIVFVIHFGTEWSAMNKRHKKPKG